MIILDTNVLSELMRPTPEPAVVAWLEARPSPDLYTTAVTQAEILHGILLLPEGKRRAALQAAALGLFEQDLAGHVLGFTSHDALPYAQIAADRRRAGRPISHFDAQIAAIARRNRASVATRNVNDFVDCGVDIVDPWRA
ncbi:MAG: type II toxin-antitoxin system VapC family toxin [Myxococcales bacterium]|nr:type II toxin-antitoxin system VapC family toxin [Myxococcales bacterium]